jgi:hypothetical protein
MERHDAVSCRGAQYRLRHAAHWRVLMLLTEGTPALIPLLFTAAQQRNPGLSGIFHVYLPVALALLGLKYRGGIRSSAAALFAGRGHRVSGRAGAGRGARRGWWVGWGSNPRPPP